MGSPSNRFNKFMPFILKEECSYPVDKSGQYRNLKNDSGGPTKWGIDLRGQRYYAGLFGEDPNEWTTSRIQALTLDDAMAIYWRFYWNGPPSNPHLCESAPAEVGEAAMNSWVNGGKPTLWMAQCHGSAGTYIDLQERYYRSLAQAQPKDRQFLSDWLGRSERLRSYLS